MSRRIKSTNKSKNNLVKSVEPPNYDNDPLLISLEKIQSGKYCLSALDESNKAMFAMAIFRRKSLTWREIKQARRHELGSEKMPKAQIKATIPTFITDDLKDFLVLRYNGRNPMVGYREKNIFFVLWFDHNFSLYKH
jgi:hypothetical protein